MKDTFDASGYRRLVENSYTILIRVNNRHEFFVIFSGRIFLIK